MLPPLIPSVLKHLEEEAERSVGAHALLSAFLFLLTRVVNMSAKWCFNTSRSIIATLS
jgi:hypothetical protein